MVGGYFLTNALFIGLLVGTNSDLNPGLIGALVEVPFDIAQVAAGGMVGWLVSNYLRKAIPFSMVLGEGPTLSGPSRNP
jgi:hypothetical protein